MVKEKGLEAIWNEGICYVKHEDYLEVVEENENLQKSFDMMRNLKDEKFRDVLKLEKELKEKDGEIEKIIHECERKRKVIIVKDNVNKELRGNIEKLEKENESLEILAKQWEKDYCECVKIVKEKDGYIGKLLEENKNIETLYNQTYKSYSNLKQFNDEVKKENEEFKKTIGELTNYLHDAEEDKQKCFEIITGISLENKKLKEHNEVLTVMLESLQPCINYCEEEKEETYTLLYGWIDNKGNKKEYKQSGLLKEEYEEMYGMDSDNWEYHILIKD